MKLNFALITILISLIFSNLSTGCDDGGGSKCANPYYVPTIITTKWTLNGTYDNGSWVTSYDACLDYDAVYVHILLTGPEEFVYETTVSCNSMESKILDDSCDRFPAGQYQVQLTLLDAQELPMTETVTGGGLLSQSTDNTPITIDFPLESFSGSEELVGTYSFDPSYDNLNCAEADPAIETVQMVFSKDDVVLPDFTFERACFNEFDIMDLPAGDLVLDMVARDASGLDIYCGSWDIKVGVGISNPIYSHNLTSEACMVN